MMMYCGECENGTKHDSRVTLCPLHAAASDMLVALEDAAEWIETGKVDGVGFDDATVLDEIRTVLARVKPSA